MYQLGLLGLLLRPSLLSFTASSILAAIVTIVANWSRIGANNPLYDYLFGADGLTTSLQNKSNTFTAISAIFDSSAAYDVAIIIFAILIGLLVYALLQSVDHMLAGAGDTLQEISSGNDSMRHLVKKEVRLRLSLRLINFLVWSIYWVFFIRVVLPASLIVGQTNQNDILNLSGPNWGYTLLSFGFLFLSLHLHVIFMRLLLLRPRVFGGEDVIVDRLNRHR